MAKISGIYVEIRGDSTQLRKDLATARQHVTEQATGMSNALNNALSPAQLKNNINGIVRNLNTLSQASKLTGKEFGAIGADLKDLQMLTGLSEKAFRDLQSRMIQTSAAKAQETALRNVAKAADLSAKEVAQLGKQMGVSAAGIAAVNGASRSASSSLSMLGTAAQAALAYFSVQTVIEFSRAVLDAGIAMDSLQRSFVAVTGSQAGAAETMSFLREEAGRLGQNFYALAPEFKNVMAAARGTAMEGENVRKMFSAVAAASTALGLSADDTHGTLRALQQMMSKGTIQAEELRGQLGERLPGALNLMATAMGVSTAELNKMMEDGKLLSDEALPKLAAELERVYGKAAETAALESAQAAVNRLSQEWTDFKLNLFESDTAVAGINAVTQALYGLNEMITAIRTGRNNSGEVRTLLDGLGRGSMLGVEGYNTYKGKVAGTTDLNRVRVADPRLGTGDSHIEMGRGLDAAAKRAKELVAEVNKADEALKKLAQTERQMLDEKYNDLKGKVSDRHALDVWYNNAVAELNEKETKKFTDEQKKQVDEHKKAREAMRKNEAETLSAIDKWMEDYQQRQIDAVASGVAERKKLREDEAKAAADAAQKIAEEQEAAAQKVMDRIQEGTADVFYDMFQDIGKGWETLWDSMKSWALRTLAELAARAATVQIIVPIMTSVTGTQDASGAIQAITGGQGGGLGNMPIGSMLGGESGPLSGVAGSINNWAANTFPGAFGGATLAQAGTPLSAVVSSPSASLAAAQAGTTLNAPLTSSGTTFLGYAGYGGWGGLGYSTLGSWAGLPQNQYSGITSTLGGMAGAWGGAALAGSLGVAGGTAAGAGAAAAGAGAASGVAAGATMGSVLPVVGTIAGAIIGGLAASLIGGKKKGTPRVNVPGNTIEWGQAEVRAGGWSGMKKEGVRAVEESLEAYLEQQFAAVDAALAGLGGKYLDMVQGQTITFGRGTPGNDISWHWSHKQDDTAKAQEVLRKKIYEAASGAFTAAGQDIAASDSVTGALGMLSEKAATAMGELVETIRAGVQSGDVEAYAAQLQALQGTMAAITQTWQAISQAADDLVEPPTAYESAVRQANAQFDEFVGTLSALGFASAQIEEIEDKRAATLARLNAEMGPLAEADAARASALADATSAVETAQGNLRAAYQREAAEIEATARKWDSFAESLKKWRDDIMAGSMSPIPASSQAGLAASRYADVLARAKLGDEDAIAELQGVAGQQLTVAKDTAKTAEDYARSALRTLDEVQSVESVATRHADIARQQLEALTSQVEALITINESVLSVVDAIGALNVAKATQSTAQAAVSSGGSSGFNADAYLVNKTASLNAPGAKQPDFYTPSSGTWSVFDTMSAIAMAGMTLEEHYLRYGIKEGIKGYASGGMHSGGLRLVGENGPELEVTGPARIWNAEDTRNLLSGGGDGTASEVRALRDDLRAIGRALAKNTADTAKLMQRWDGDGMPEVRVA